MKIPFCKLIDLSFRRLSKRITCLLIINLAICNSAAASYVNTVIIDCYDSNVDKAGTKNGVQVEYYDQKGKIHEWVIGWQASAPGMIKTTERVYPPCDNIYDAFAGKVTSSQPSIRSVQIRTTGGDALWIDELFLANGWDVRNTFGREGGLGWCLSTETNDHTGKWKNYVGGPCAPCWEFRTVDNKVYHCSKPNPNPGFKISKGRHYDYERIQAQEAIERVAAQEAKDKAIAQSKELDDKMMADLTKGKTAYQSSTGYKGVASRAIDGNTNQNYAANSTTHTADGDKMPWWEVDLGAVYNISHIQIHNRTDCCTNRLEQAQIILSETPLPKKSPVSGSQMQQMFAMSRPQNAPLRLIKLSNAPADFELSIQNKNRMIGKKAGPYARHTPARYIRIQLPRAGYLHLSEVKVIGMKNPI